jgi:xanthine dehydrogenase accessory factor
MRELLPVVEDWRVEGTGFGRAVLIRAFGSAPRPEGATLLLADDGRIAGSVSGGCVEGACVDEIRRARAGGLSRVVRYGISDDQAWEVGLACGSTIDVLIEPDLRPQTEQAARASADEAVVIPLPEGSPGPADGPHPAASAVPGAVVARPEQRLATAVTSAVAAGRSTVAVVDDRQYFIEVFPARPRLVVFGAVQVAMPLVRFAAELGYRTTVVDARPVFATRERFPTADELVVGWPQDVADRLALAPPDAVAVLTHDPKLDEPAILAAMHAGCRYVGAIGSRRTQAARRERLAAAGLSPQQLDRLRGPIGLDLGGRDPAETALAIMAEVVAARHGATGGPLHARAR